MNGLRQTLEAAPSGAKEMSYVIFDALAVPSGIAGHPNSRCYNAVELLATGEIGMALVVWGFTNNYRGGMILRDGTHAENCVVYALRDIGLLLVRTP